MENKRKIIEQYFDENSYLGKLTSVDEAEVSLGKSVYIARCNEHSYRICIDDNNDIQVEELKGITSIGNTAAMAIASSAIKGIKPHTSINIGSSLSRTYAALNIVKPIRITNNLSASLFKVNIPKVDLGYTSALKNLGISLANIYQPVDSITPAMGAVSQALKNIAIQQETFKKLAKKLLEHSKPYKAIKIISENQIVFWNKPNSKLVDLLINADQSDVDEIMEKYYMKDKDYSLESVIDETKVAFQSEFITRLYNQSISAYNLQQYELCIIGLFAIVDYLLSSVSGIAAVGIRKRGEIILNKLESNEELESEEYSIFCLSYTFDAMTEKIQLHFDFGKDSEPKEINRHWLMHGRSNRNISRMDCIKIINYIYSIIIINEITTDD